MARIRQARRCSARRTDGEHCRAYAITGGYVCRAHGGAAPRVRRAALVRSVEAQLRAGFEKDYARWRLAVRERQAGRILAAAAWLGIPPGEVNDGDILMAVIEGVVPGEGTMPAISYDRRFGPRPGRRKEAPVQAVDPATDRFRDAFARAAEAWENECGS